jgi:hypothetical protein
MRALRMTFALVLVAIVGGCGSDRDRPAQALGPGGLGHALEMARGAGRLPMRLEATTTRPGRGTRRQFDAAGHLDVAQRAGDATLQLDGLGLPRGLTVRWTAREVSVGGQAHPREQARIDGGQLGKLPDEVQALADLVADGQGIRERANGSWTFSVRSADAVRRGIPPQPDAGDTWTGEAEADAGGRLRRVVLRLPTPALGPSIPAGVAALELTLG